MRALWAAGAVVAWGACHLFVGHAPTPGKGADTRLDAARDGSARDREGSDQPVDAPLADRPRIPDERAADRPRLDKKHIDKLVPVNDWLTPIDKGKKTDQPKPKPDLPKSEGSVPVFDAGWACSCSMGTASSCTMACPGRNLSCTRLVVEWICSCTNFQRTEAYSIPNASLYGCEACDQAATIYFDQSCLPTI